MKAQLSGKAYVVGDSIDTDQIIPAAHLVYSMSVPEERRQYGRYALSGLPDDQAGLPDGGIPLTQPDAFRSEFSIVVAGSNYGCGSSREHAPFAMREAGIEVVIAASFARIFYRNAVDGGFVVPFESAERLVDVTRTGDSLEIDTVDGTVRNERSGTVHRLQPLGDVADILAAGDLFSYARKAGLMGGTGR